MNPAPIYLLVNGEPDGPHDCEDVDALLAGGEIQPACLASIEGMPAWRSVEETLVWARAKILMAIKPAILPIVERMVDNGLDLRYARIEVSEALQRKRIVVDMETVQSLAMVLNANACLLRSSRQYPQDTAPDGLDAFPAREMLPFGKLSFRRDWAADWVANGGTLSGDRMIARKDDVIWAKMSDFGYPFPPFSLDVAMWVQDVSFTEASKLGVVSRRDVTRGIAARPFELIGL